MEATMDRPRFHVDFNELLEPMLVCLSVDDVKTTDRSERIFLHDGMLVEVYDEDVDSNGNPDNLIAQGVVERNNSIGPLKRAKWCCRIDSHGIQHESDR
jgi:hypothetical protein